MNTPVPSPKRYLVPTKDKTKTFRKKTSTIANHSGAFTHISSELHIYGIENPSDIERAIERALKILLNTHTDTQIHFQNTWLGGENGIERLWEMSETAYRLTLINLAVHSPSLSQMLLRHIKFFK